MAGYTDKADRSGRRERADECAARIVEQTEKLEPFADSSAQLRVGKVIGTAALKSPRRKPRW
jgi:hypothetical protein